MTWTVVLGQLQILAGVISDYPRENEVLVDIIISAARVLIYKHEIIKIRNLAFLPLLSERRLLPSLIAVDYHLDPLFLLEFFEHFQLIFLAMHIKEVSLKIEWTYLTLFATVNISKAVSWSKYLREKTSFIYVSEITFCLSTSLISASFWNFSRLSVLIYPSPKFSNIKNLSVI